MDTEKTQNGNGFGELGIGLQLIVEIIEARA